MGRRKKGLVLYVDNRTGVFVVRFTLEGKRYTLSTGERDSEAAQAAAARLFDAAKAGKRKRRVVDALDLEDLLDEWLAAIESEVSPETASMYETHAFAHLYPHFKNTARLTTPEISDYVRKRLRKVQRGTVRLELTSLRRFLAFLVEQDFLAEAPEVPKVPRGAAGTVHSKGKRKRVDLTPEQVDAILTALPYESRGVLMRPYFTVMWETGLRKGTLDRILVEDHYRPGEHELWISADVDKSRFERWIDLPCESQQALEDAVETKQTGELGLIFGAHDRRECLRTAAKAAGIKDWDRVSCHDFRHARLTQWGSTTRDVASLAYLAGHRQLTTSSRYVHPRREGARDLILATEMATDSKSKRKRPKSGKR